VACRLPEGVRCCLQHQGAVIVEFCRDDKTVASVQNVDRRVRYLLEISANSTSTTCTTPGCGQAVGLLLCKVFGWMWGSATALLSLPAQDGILAVGVDCRGSQRLGGRTRDPRGVHAQRGRTSAAVAEATGHCAQVNSVGEQLGRGIVS
jgi:hypothetical protein